MKRIFSAFLVTLVLGSTLMLTFHVQPAKSESVTLTVIGPWSGVEMDTFLAVLEAFENQTGMNVSYSVLRAEDLATLLPAQFAVETAPGDVIFMWPWFIKQYGQMGHILDVTALIDEPDFLDGALDPVEAIGKLYGGAYTGTVKPGFWYRKSFFAANGLAEPASWAEFVTLLGDIAAIPGVVNPILSGDAVGWPLSDVTEHFIATFGGPDLHRNLTAGTAAWTSSRVRTVLADRLVPLLQGNFSDPKSWDAYLTNWWNGEYGLYFMGTWITGMVPNATDLGVIPLPGYDALVLPTDYFFIPAYTDHLSEAEQLFEFLAGIEAQTLEVAQGGHVATNLGVPLEAYPAVDRIVANLTAGKEVLPDLDDTIGGAFQITFWDQLKLLWSDPAKLDDVLNTLEESRQRHDVAIVNVATSKTGCTPVETLGEGSPIDFTTTIKNEGDFNETFTVQLWANATMIAEHQVVDLMPGATTLWEAHDVIIGGAKGNVEVTANAVMAAMEGDVADNIYVYGHIFKTLAGDVDGDRDVDIFDVVRMATAYGTATPDPRYDPNCDLDGDGDVDIFDIVAAVYHYGDSW